MSAERHQRLMAAFDVLIDLPADEQIRGAQVWPESDLRSELQKMLEADRKASSFLSIAPAFAAQLLEPPTPQTLGGYLLGAEVGRGRLGTVVEAGPKVVVRLIHQWLLPSAARTRFLSEVERLQIIRHPSFPAVLAAGVDDGRGWLAIERVDGTSLSNWAKTASRKSIVALLARLCEALNFGHLRGLVHRQFCASSVLVLPGDSPRLLDMGVVQAISDAVRGRPELAVGPRTAGIPTILETPAVAPTEPERPAAAVLAPEQLDASKVVDLRADVWAFGRLAAELLGNETGPFASIVRKATAQSPDSRYGSTLELRDDLVACMSGRRVQSHPATTLYRLRCFFREHSQVIAWATVLAGVAVAGWMNRPASSPPVAVSTPTFLEDTLALRFPLPALQREVTVRQALDAAAAHLDTAGLPPRDELTSRLALGRAYSAQGAAWESLAQFELGLSLFNDGRLVGTVLQADALREAAYAALSTGALAEAAQHLAKAAKLSGQTPEQALAEGTVAFEQGRPIEAVAALSRASLWRGKLALAQTHLLTGNFEAAVQSLPSLANLSLESQAEVLVVTASIATARGQPARGLANAKQGLALALPAGDIARARLKVAEADALLLLGQVPQARAAADEGFDTLNLRLGSNHIHTRAAGLVQARALGALNPVAASALIDDAAKAWAVERGSNHWRVCETRAVAAAWGAPTAEAEQCLISTWGKATPLRRFSPAKSKR